MRIKEPPRQRAILLPNFPKHPPDGFVNEIVAVVKEQAGNGQCVVELAASNEVGCRDDGDASLPQ
jgi:hypothetical protein